MDAGAVQSMGDLAMMQASKPGRAATGGNIDKTAQNFEAMFLSQMMKPMFDTVNVDPVFGGGHGEEIMRTFLVQEYGKIAAKGSHFGLADAIKKEMIRDQDITRSSGGQNAVIR